MSSSNSIWHTEQLHPGPVKVQGVQSAYHPEEDRYLPDLLPGFRVWNSDRRTVPVPSMLYTTDNPERLMDFNNLTYEQMDLMQDSMKTNIGRVAHLNLPSSRNVRTLADGTPLGPEHQDQGIVDYNSLLGLNTMDYDPFSIPTPGSAGVPSQKEVLAARQNLAQKFPNMFQSQSMGNVGGGSGIAPINNVPSLLPADAGLGPQNGSVVARAEEFKASQERLRRLKVQQAMGPPEITFNSILSDIGVMTGLTPSADGKLIPRNLYSAGGSGISRYETGLVEYLNHEPVPEAKNVPIFTPEEFKNLPLEEQNKYRENMNSFSLASKEAGVYDTLGETVFHLTQAIPLLPIDFFGTDPEYGELQEYHKLLHAMKSYDVEKLNEIMDASREYRNFYIENFRQAEMHNETSDERIIKISGAMQLLMSKYYGLIAEREFNVPSVQISHTIGALENFRRQNIAFLQTNVQDRDLSKFSIYALNTQTYQDVLRYTSKFYIGSTKSDLSALEIIDFYRDAFKALNDGQSIVKELRSSTTLSSLLISAESQELQDWLNTFSDENAFEIFSEVEKLFAAKGIPLPEGANSKIPFESKTRQDVETKIAQSIALIGYLIAETRPGRELLDASVYSQVQLSNFHNSFDLRFREVADGGRRFPTTIFGKVGTMFFGQNQDSIDPSQFSSNYNQALAIEEKSWRDAMTGKEDAQQSSLLKYTGSIAKGWIQGSMNSIVDMENGIVGSKSMVGQGVRALGKVATGLWWQSYRDVTAAEAGALKLATEAAVTAWNPLQWGSLASQAANVASSNVISRATALPGVTEAAKMTSPVQAFVDLGRGISTSERISTQLTAVAGALATATGAFASTVAGQGVIAILGLYASFYGIVGGYKQFKKDFPQVKNIDEEIRRNLNIPSEKMYSQFSDEEQKGYEYALQEKLEKGELSKIQERAKENIEKFGFKTAEEISKYRNQRDIQEIEEAKHEHLLQYIASTEGANKSVQELAASNRTYFVSSLSIALAKKLHSFMSEKMETKGEGDLDRPVVGKFTNPYKIFMGEQAAKFMNYTGGIVSLGNVKNLISTLTGAGAAVLSVSTFVESCFQPLSPVYRKNMVDAIMWAAHSAKDEAQLSASLTAIIGQGQALMIPKATPVEKQRGIIRKAVDEDINDRTSKRQDTNQ